MNWKYPNINVCLIALFTFTYNCYIINAKEAPFIHKCKAEDSQCIKESVQAAVPILAADIPSLGVDTLDPMKIDKIDVISRDLKLILTDVIVTGFRNCVTNKVRRDLVESTIFIEFLCAIELNGNYDMSGKLLTMPIEGRGDMKILLKNSSFAAEANIEFVKKSDGKTYWHINGWKHSFELYDKPNILFNNLFNGNEALAREAQDAIDSNINELMLLISDPIINSMADKIKMTINQFYDAVPGENLALD